MFWCVYFILLFLQSHGRSNLVVVVLVFSYSITQRFLGFRFSFSGALKSDIIVLVGSCDGHLEVLHGFQLQWFSLLRQQKAHYVTMVIHVSRHATTSQWSRQELFVVYDGVSTIEMWLLLFYFEALFTVENLRFCSSIVVVTTRYKTPTSGLQWWRIMGLNVMVAYNSLVSSRCFTSFGANSFWQFWIILVVGSGSWVVHSLIYSLRRLSNVVDLIRTVVCTLYETLMNILK